MVGSLPRLVCALFVASLALPGVAYGAEVIGSDLGGTELGGSCNVADGCVIVQEQIGGTFVEPSSRGVITQWTTRGAVGPMALRTYRHRAGETFVEGELHATALFQSDGVETGNGTTQSFGTDIPVQAGDYIALVLGDGSDYAHRQNPPANTAAFLFGEHFPSQNVDVSSDTAIELYLRARVEPDVDNDGLGDESQDPCVGCGPALPTPPAKPAAQPAPDPYAAIRAAGPRIALASRARASRKGTVPIVLTNPYGFSLKGTLSLKDGKRKAGSKRFSLGPNAKRAINVRLPRKVFRRLKRKRRLRLTAAAKGKAAVGKSRTTRRKVLVTSPAKKRKRKPTAPVVGPPADGTYVGRTVQGRSITIRTINNRRQIRVFASTASTNSCLYNGSPSQPQIINILPPVPFPVDAAGNFSLDARNENEDYDPNYRIRGKFTGNSVSGFFAWRRFKPLGSNNETCVTKELTFQATRQP